MPHEPHSNQEDENPYFVQCKQLNRRGLIQCSFYLNSINCLIQYNWIKLCHG
ncbi:hypothetical protein Lalb_Chr14g0372941 [Lupinus albus]|uniref:Uncharacterized protein n=1 Tax=Lupinus albus TaxID=3870 RepID=A0A6A4PG53_LUPAL|nr:hypothetical protein Lalb_Chr14g0372941 [Lupinus albus]